MRQSGPAGRDGGLEGVVAQLSLSPGGVPKRPVQSARVLTQGLEGDAQRDLRNHGGPDRAVCLYSLEVVQRLQAEGHPIQPGSTGENITLCGIDWARVGEGSRFQVGPHVLLEVTRFAPPCASIEGSFAGGLFRRISERHHPGWSRVYARVLAEGEVRVGDRTILLAP